METYRIIVTGAHGQLGSEIKELARQSKHDFIFIDIDSLDLRDEKASWAYFCKLMPKYIINCAAYTAVDKAESDEENAFAINAEIPRMLGDFSMRLCSSLIHISTDYVFSGDEDRPLTEIDHPNPKSIYGKTKLAGEQSIQALDNTIVLRTAWLYSSYGNNFVKSMLRLMEEKEELKIVNDQFGTPTYAADLAKAILQIINYGDAGFKPGIYHYSNEGSASWYDFALAIKKLSGSNCSLIPIPSEEYPVPARRPKYSIFAKEKIKNQFDIEIPDWELSLEQCMKKIKA